MVAVAASLSPQRALPTPRVEVHDREQLEIQLGSAIELGDREKDAVDLEIYLFVPRNVGLNESNYTRDDFYADTTDFVRVDMPPLDLDELADVRSRRSPLFTVLRELDAMRAGAPPTNAIALALRLYGDTFTEAVRARASALEARIESMPRQPAENRWELIDAVDELGREACRALEALRRVRWSCRPFRRAAPDFVIAFPQIDEYSSLFLDSQLARLAACAEGIPALFDGSGFVARLRQVLARHAEPEAAYRGDAGYLNLDPSNPKSAEYFAYRKSQLKKAVQQALYVDTRRLPTDRFVRNATGMVAAGLAATWAVAAQLPLTLQGLSASTQLMVMALPVAAYVAKDRIKELTREWLTGRLQEFDHYTGLRAGGLADVGLATVSGRLCEHVRFITPDGVPPDVLSARTVNRTVNGVELLGETVLAYRRRLELQRTERDTELGIRQIVRLNLRHYLTRLDEAEQPALHWAPGERRFMNLTLPKVYHVNLLARVVKDGRARVTRWRVILNKQGIVRHEEVAFG